MAFYPSPLRPVVSLSSFANMTELIPDATRSAKNFCLRRETLLFDLRLCRSSGRGRKRGVVSRMFILSNPRAPGWIVSTRWTMFGWRFGHSLILRKFINNVCSKIIRGSTSSNILAKLKLINLLSTTFRTNGSTSFL